MDITRTKNFLHYLALLSGIEIFDNKLLQPLYKPMALARIRKGVEAWLRRQEGSSCGRGVNVYVSVPFCAEECAYCHCFHSRYAGTREVDGYVRQLMAQAADFSPSFSGIPMESIYFGGGTPSLLSAPQLERMMQGLARRLDISRCASFGFEAHPHSLTLQKLRVLKGFGLTRLSIGVQSFDRKVLRTVGRGQKPEGVEECMAQVRKAGVRSLNIDLMAGLPGQTVASFLKDVRRVLSWEPQEVHLNPFSSDSAQECLKNFSIPAKDFFRARAEMIREGISLLHSHGFSRHGFESFQRRQGEGNYQEYVALEQRGGFLGLGARAKSYFPGEVSFKAEQKYDVLFSPEYSGCEATERYAMANYAIFHMLTRLDPDEFRKVFAKDLFCVFRDELSALKRQGFIRQEGSSLLMAKRRTFRTMFEFLAMAKVLHGYDLLKRLVQGYNPFEDYGSAAHTLQACYNYEISCMVYGTGI